MDATIQSSSVDLILKTKQIRFGQRHFDIVGLGFAILTNTFDSSRIVMYMDVDIDVEVVYVDVDP